MRGPKLNEGATAIGERHGTKATAKYIRSSAYKARVVLDLIRGLPVHEADQVLQFTERGIAREIRKVLASAVANATDADSGAFVGDADELFVLACFADEGPTLRRFRPRARGRATRIRKRTCHITVVVARMSDDRLEVVRARAEGRSANQAANRRARVERSRQRAEAAKEAVDHVDAEEALEDGLDEDEGSDDEGSVDAAADVAVEDEGSDADAADEATADEATEDEATEAEDEGSDEAAADEAETVADEADGGYAAGEWAGSVLPADDGSGPDTHPIKGNADSMLYHAPDSRYYKVTKAEVWFDTEESAQAAGFSKPGTKKDED